MRPDGRTLLWVFGLGTTAVAPLLPHGYHGQVQRHREAYLAGSELLLSQALAGVTLLIAAALLLGPVVRGLRSGAPALPTPGAWGPAAHVALATALFVAAGIVSAALSEHGSVDPMDLFGVLLLAALYVGSQQPFPQLLGQLRVLLRCFIWGSLLSIAVMPADWAFLAPGGAATRDYLGTGWGQFMGLSANPNLLGPLAAVALLLELCAVARGRAWPLHAAAALSALVLTQSRTAWLASAAVLLLHTGPRFKAAKRTLLVLGAVAAPLLLLLPWLHLRMITAVSGVRDAAHQARGLAWRLAWEEFREAPLFGYGPSLFDPEHRTQLFGTADHWIGQAHNQFLHTMGATGVFGLIGLCALVAALIVRARRTAAATKGLSAALVATLLVECATESPLRNLNGLSDRVLFAVAIWTVLVCRTPSEERGPQPPARSALPHPADPPMEHPCPVPR
ncbi:O-antigen ligase [Streptomyces sp. N35]|uniref:O-antigen ligase family protein n=1 Tax=Streptomyces sp. N35 TaxID=2795730 RepID=UPI0018F4814E|nr:O-antigen ligase family protein [Streptomyces sp. N35]